MPRGRYLIKIHAPLQYSWLSREFLFLFLFLLAARVRERERAGYAACVGV